MPKTTPPMPTPPTTNHADRATARLTYVATMANAAYYALDNPVLARGQAVQALQAAFALGSPKAAYDANAMLCALASKGRR